MIADALTRPGVTRDSGSCSRSPCVTSRPLTRQLPSGQSGFSPLAIGRPVEWPPSRGRRRHSRRADIDISPPTWTVGFVVFYWRSNVMKGMFAALAARIDAAIAEASSGRATMGFTFWLIRSSILEAWRDGLAGRAGVRDIDQPSEVHAGSFPLDLAFGGHVFLPLDGKRFGAYAKRKPRNVAAIASTRAMPMSRCLAIPPSWARTIAPIATSPLDSNGPSRACLVSWPKMLHITCQ